MVPKDLWFPSSMKATSRCANIFESLSLIGPKLPYISKLETLETHVGEGDLLQAVRTVADNFASAIEAR